MRSFLLGDKTKVKTLPYDAEVEYLESFGAQWIDTGITPNTETLLDINFTLTKTDSSYRAFCASRTSNSSNDQFSFVFFSGGYAGFGSQEVSFVSYPYVGGKYTIRMDKSALRLWRELDGQTVNYNANFSPRTVESLLNLYLFARNTAGTASNFSYCQMHHCKLTKDGELVRDFIPVRVGTIGYMYDRVSGVLFANKGSGAFGIGPDKEVA